MRFIVFWRIQNYDGSNFCLLSIINIREVTSRAHKIQKLLSITRWLVNCRSSVLPSNLIHVQSPWRTSSAYEYIGHARRYCPEATWAKKAFTFYLESTHEQLLCNLYTVEHATLIPWALHITRSDALLQLSDVHICLICEPCLVLWCKSFRNPVKWVPFAVVANLKNGCIM